MKTTCNFLGMAFLVLAMLCVAGCTKLDDGNENGGGGGGNGSNGSNGGEFPIEPSVPPGALSGVFSVNSMGTKVHFSQGNLHYTALKDKWGFANRQYYYEGNTNSSISPTYYSRIDLFGWGTSGWNCGNTYYYPWASNYSSPRLYGPLGQYGLSGEYALSDWGVFNAISNGGNLCGQWRTLTHDEWDYVINGRNTASGIRYAKATVDDYCGLVLLPDDWNSSTYTLNETNQERASYNSNIICLSDWNNMESNGAVFLPSAGCRNDNEVACVNANGLYWSSSCLDDHHAYYLVFSNGGLDANSNALRSNGMSVRLVCYAEEHGGCSYSIPVVETKSVDDVTGVSATGRGAVMSDGGGSIIRRGMCWSTSPNPTINDNCSNSGIGQGPFTSEITGLASMTKYYVRAYATNSVGTGYGEQQSFTTTSSTSIPTGAINGRFSVSSDMKVYFSKGNLQYLCSAGTPYWKFADSQWDYFGISTGQNSASQTVDRDLFGWGTSGYHNPDDRYNRNYYPYSTSTSNVNNSYNTWGYGPSTNMADLNLTGTSENYDWGVYNAIYNGGNVAGQWRTLTSGEWEYVVYTRITSSGIRFAMAQVAGVNGLILLPDNWNESIYALNNTNQPKARFSSNVIDASEWRNTLEVKGAVFLPASGKRSGTTVSDYWLDDFGWYWSSTYDTRSAAYALYIRPQGLYMYNDGRSLGGAVRLVCPAE